MDLNEQARVTHDQMQINRVQQAVIAVALEKKSNKVIRFAETKAAIAIRILAASGSEWLTSDATLLDNVRSIWKFIRE